MLWEQATTHIVAAANFTTFTINNLGTGGSIDVRTQPGLLGVVIFGNSTQTTLSFVFDTAANRTAFNTAMVPITGQGSAFPPTDMTLDDNFRFVVNFNQVNTTGGFADVSNALYCRNGAEVLGITTTDVLHARSCVELFNEAATVYSPTVTGITRGTTTQDLVVNLDDDVGSGVIGEGGIDLAAIPVDNYIYFAGFPHAGVFRRFNLIIGAFTLPYFAWGSFLGVEYGNQFTNGQPAIIPSGTEYFEVTEAQLELQSYDANIGLIVEPDLTQVHTSQVRLVDLPTASPGGTGFLYSQTGAQLGFTGAAATQNFVLIT